MGYYINQVTESISIIDCYSKALSDNNFFPTDIFSLNPNCKEAYLNKGIVLNSLNNSVFPS